MIATMARCWFAIVVSVLCGCGTASFQLTYQPESAPRPLVAERLPRIYLERVEDRTPEVFNLPGTPLNAQFDPPAQEALRDALQTEFGRLGLPLIADRTQADAVLQAVLSDSSFNAGAGFRASSLGLLLSLKSPGDAPVWETTLIGTGRDEGIFFSQSSVQRALTRAFASLMDQIGSTFEEQGVIPKIFAAADTKPATAPPHVTTATPARSDVDELPAVQTPPRDKAYAVVIGIRRYQQALPEADFADADAALIRSYLTRLLGYRDVNVAYLTNEQATKSGFEKFLESWLPNRVEPGAEVFVYFSGHGAPNPKTGDAYLVPYDGDPTYLDKTGYPLKRLYTELSRLPAGRITVVMDSCFSGAGGRSVLAKGARPLVMVPTASGVPERLSVLSAAAGDQISYAYQDKGHGLFTYFLLQGLKTQAGSGLPDISAAFAHAAPLVAATARREYNADQVPQWSGKR